MARALTWSTIWTVILHLSALVAGATSSSSSWTGNPPQLCMRSPQVTGTGSSVLLRDCKSVQLEQHAGCSAAVQALLQQCQLAQASNVTGDPSTVVAAGTSTGTPTTSDSSAAAAPHNDCRVVEYTVRQWQCDGQHTSHAHGAHAPEERGSSTAATADSELPSHRQAVNYKWAAAVGSVAVISIAGFGILSVVPALSKVMYKGVLQFLVALAIGTLVGDAVLHLLPHALLSSGSQGAEHDHDHDHDSGSSERGHSHGEHEGSSGSSHTAVTWRASMALVGVLVFYNAERLLGVFTQKKADHDREKLPHQPQSCSDPHSAECDSCDEVGVVVGHSSTEMKNMVKTAHENYHALSGLPCHAQAVGPAATGVIDTAAAAEQPDLGLGVEPLLGAPPALLSPPAAHDAAEFKSCNGITPPSTSKEQPKGSSHAERCSPCRHRQLPSAVVGIGEKQLLASGARDAPVSLAVPMSGHGDVEGHGHSHHFNPSSLSSVAYMVIAGDGMHNFTDGLAIGVAFSASLIGGLGTAVAVLCHELPHELGDFAMLLKAGMTIKQAFLCNVISAVLCLTGSIIGVAAGSVSSDGEQWLFAFCGGIFLYIALVDMMPEISRVDKNRPLLQLLIQDLGLLTGFCIMLTIALFEHSIEKAFMQHLPQN